MGGWSFLTNHARVLLCIARDPGVRLRDIAADIGVTERSAHGIVTDLVEAGYVVKDKDGRRNRYGIQEHLPLRDPLSQERTIGEMLDLLVGVNAHRTPTTTTEGAHDGRQITPQGERQEGRQDAQGEAQREEAQARHRHEHVHDDEPEAQVMRS
jgi:hypothetical protein